MFRAIINFTSETNIAKTLTATGATVSTTSPKFGTGAAIFDGIDDYIDTPDHADFNFGTGNFTIDFWIKRGNVDAGNQYMGGQMTSAGAEEAIVRLGADSIRFFINTTESGVLSTPASVTTITSTTTWYHIAIVRNGNTLTQYIDGTADGTLDLTGKTHADPTSKYTLGRGGEYTTSPFNGRIDEFRVSKGVARWTANFTPESAAYDADSYSQTGLLVHCDGTNGSTTFTDDDVIPAGTTAKNGLFFGTNF